MNGSKESKSKYDRTYYLKNKEKILGTHRKYTHKHRKELAKKSMDRYRSDFEYRERKKKIMRKYGKKRYKKKKLGNPDTIKELCKDFGFSNDVSNAIALDGVILDNKLKETGII